MSLSGQYEPEHQGIGSTTALPSEQAGRQAGERAEQLPDLMRQIAAFNGENKAHEDLWSRTRQMTDRVSHGEEAARQADTDWANADLYHKAVQAEDPDRTASRLRQWLIAGVTLTFDGVACYFAAEALGGSPAETLAWSVLFLALLGAGEVALDLYRETHPVLWRWIAVILGAFIALLGVLRFWFLATVGTEGLVTAAAGAILFTVATAGFVIFGYRALRIAETGAAWRARRAARVCKKAAAQAHHKVERLRTRRDSLARAYLSRIRARLIQSCSASQLAVLEQAVRAHLIGQDQS